MEKPEFVTDDQLEFLDDLRESGATNMFGATPYIQEAYPELSTSEARELLKYWMESFSTRHA